jgi:cyclohexadieny/prephenate dehydrogenase
MINIADDLESALKSEVLKYAAGGFTDFTRIAAADPTMWRDVFLHNKPALLDVVGRYIDNLVALQQLICGDEGEALHHRFDNARAVRSEVARAGQAYKRLPAETAGHDARFPRPPAAITRELARPLGSLP